MDGYHTLGVLVVLTLILAAFSPPCNAETKQSGCVTVQNARFTVITPNLIRIEYSRDGKFIDARSIFAINRDARLSQYKLTEKDGSTIIDTDAIRLTYKPDGKPFHPGNLQATIKKSRGTVNWAPGMENTGNLGGTVLCLDGSDGAQKLDDGILSRGGWYLLDDSRGHLLTEDWLQSRSADAGTDWYLFGYGADYLSALKSFTTISGPVPLPRKYVLGAWYSRYWPYTSDEYCNIVKEYASHDFPLDVMVLDMDWHKEGWTAYSWNYELIPDPEGMMKWLHQQDLVLCLNQHATNGVPPNDDMYEAYMRDMGADPTRGDVLGFDAGSKKFLDILFKHTHTPLEEQGVDFWWLDAHADRYTKSIPDLRNIVWLNHYYYQHTSRDGKRGLSFSRWAGLTDHRNPIHFSGDAGTSWKMLAFEVPFTSTSGNIGCFFWSHDIGGHMGDRNEESYTRWCQFGAVTAALRSHSTREANLDRRPWTYPKWAEDSMRKSFHLRSELFPYIYTSAWQSCVESIPLNRPMYLAYPNQEEAYHNPQQFFLGDNLLAAPIVSPGIGKNQLANQVVWFPEGTWYDFFTGERFTGPATVVAAAEIDEFPLYARGGVPIPMQPYTERMTTAKLDTLVVRCYPGEDGKTGESTLYEDDGISVGYTKGEFAVTRLSYNRTGSKITVKIAPTKGKYNGQMDKRAYIIELPCTENAHSAKVDGKRVEFEYDHRTRMNRVVIPSRSISKGCEVVVEAEMIDSDRLHLETIARRAGLSEKLANCKSVSEMITQESLNDEEMSLLYMAAGIVIKPKNENTYGYPDDRTPYLFCPKELVDSKATVRWKLDERCGDRKRCVVIGHPANKLINSKIEIPDMVPVCRPLGPSSEYATCADIEVDGKVVSIYGPWQRCNLADCKSNIAPKAKVAGSSSCEDSGFGGAVDGIIGGYPENDNEWTSNGEKAGTWIRLEWDEPVSIDSIWLFDRPNLDDHIKSGEIEFSDGSKMTVGELPNDSSDAAVLDFPAKTTKWLKFTVTETSEDMSNIGLSEIAVFEVGVR